MILKQPTSIGSGPGGQGETGETYQRRFLKADDDPISNE